MEAWPVQEGDVAQRGREERKEKTDEYRINKWG